MKQFTHQDLRERTRDKILELRKRGYTVKQYWSCDVQRELAIKPEMKDFYEQQDLSPNSDPIHPRSMLYGKICRYAGAVQIYFAGGRTEPLRAITRLTPAEIERGVKIKHYDMCSMYPAALFDPYGRGFALGHPKILHSSDLPDHGRNISLENIRQYFGIVFQR
jgi:hypothetical protein